MAGATDTKAGRPVRISIVTPSFNQGDFIERTIRSVLDQNYPDVEHIVVDAVSRDGTAEVLDRYPHLVVIREPDRGQADAVNKGFARATGGILAFLNADDTLEPGSLARVAAEIDPSRDRHVVMGRCRFVDEADRFTGIEHPSGFESHERVLAIWRGHWLPQPAVFWSRQAWERAGPLDADEHLVLDYDFFCRLSRDFRFHQVDQVFANYRLHRESKTALADDGTRLRESCRVSRRYWGAPWRPMWWRLALSWLDFRIDRTGRGVALLRRAERAWRRRAVASTLGFGIAGTLLAPDVTFLVAVYPSIRRRLIAVGRRVRRGGTAAGGAVPAAMPVSPQTSAYMANTGVWQDGWVGPRLVVTASGSDGVRAFRLSGEVDFDHLAAPLGLTLTVGGGAAVEVCLDRPGPFDVAVPAAGGGETVVVQVDADRFFVPHAIKRNRDYRPLSWRFREFVPETK